MILEQSCSINCTAELGSCCFSDCSVINGTGCLEKPVAHPQCDVILESGSPDLNYIYIRDQTCEGCTACMLFERSVCIIYGILRVFSVK